MATVYVIYAKEDAAFVKQRLLPPLPSNGYHYWLARHHFAGVEPDKQVIAQALEQCQAILIVLSQSLLRSPASIEETDIALAGGGTLIVVQIEAVDKQETLPLVVRLGALAKIDFALEEEGEAERLLVGLLPTTGSNPALVPSVAERLEWNEEIFGAALRDATARHDNARAESLVATILDHLSDRPYSYPSKQAFNDLKMLRNDRQFELMRRYAEAVIASGTNKDQVRCLYGQALIETGQYGRALEVLRSVTDDPDSSRDEIFEAQGLIGRTYKQRYVNAPYAAGADELLRQAISAYEIAYLEDQNNFWHGVNAASCILRAERDGIAAAPPGRAQEIAEQIVHDLGRLSGERALPVWDCASRVEALLALEHYDEAEGALELYLHHPGMGAFEVSSTFRQYAEVLELARTPRGVDMLGRLRRTMERYRAGNVNIRPATSPGHRRKSDAKAGSKSLIIQLEDSAWEPKNITDLVIQSRLGKIVTARGSDMSVRKLLNDSKVISVEESRPAGQIECDRSLPFIRVAAQYTNNAGTYTEAGDRALIAVIDDGIDVLHKAFLDADGNSRIIGIWDQTDTNGDGPTPPGFSYGVFYDAAAIARYVVTGEVPLSLSRNQPSHGTHVASIAAGRGAGAFAGGVAPDARLLVVVSASSGPIGYSATHIDALSFINAFADKLGLPVIVNVSQGMNAGAHDGSSMLEYAFDAFSESGGKAGRVVVKSAGNERGKGGHAKVTMLSDALEKLRWRRSPGADDKERIELWWSSKDEIRFRLRQPVPAGTPIPQTDPSENWSDWVGVSAPEQKGTFPKDGSYRLSFTKSEVRSADSFLLIELGNDTGQAGFGDWTLEMQGGNVEEGEVHCWIERTRGVPSLFLNHGDEEMTLSIPGTARSVISVGAVDACKPIQVGDTSSYGPTRDGQKKPLVCAPGVNVRAAEGGTGDGTFLKTGTSMAAPHVTGAIALLLSRAAKAGKALSSKQIAVALQTKTQNYNGRWDRGQGYGVIDVSALLASFD